MSDNSTRASLAKQPRPFGAPIKVLVGPEEATFHIHEGIIRSSSKFIDNAMKPGSTEFEKGGLRLADDDPESFTLYQEWLYSRQIHLEREEPIMKYLPACKAYCLGEKLMDNDFKNAVVDTIIRTTTETTVNESCFFPSVDSICVSYERTPRGSPLRQLIVDFYAYCGDEREYASDEMQESWPREFLVDLTIALSRLRDAKVLDRCPWVDESSVKDRYYSK